MNTLQTKKNVKISPLFLSAPGPAVLGIELPTPAGEMTVSEVIAPSKPVRSAVVVDNVTVHESSFVPDVWEFRGPNGSFVVAVIKDQKIDAIGVADGQPFTIKKAPGGDELA